MAKGLVNQVDGGSGQTTMDVENEGREFAVGAGGRCLLVGDYVCIGILVGLVLVVFVDINVGRGCGVECHVHRRAMSHRGDMRYRRVERG